MPDEKKEKHKFFQNETAKRAEKLGLSYNQIHADTTEVLESVKRSNEKHIKLMKKLADS